VMNRYRKSIVTSVTGLIVKDKGWGIVQEESEQEFRRSQTAVFRVSILLLFVVIAFVIFRHLSIPKSFGQYGYYRGDNVEEWASLDQNYAPGSRDCSKCHANEFQATIQAEHNQLDCQSCHGPLLAHMRSPNESHPKVVGNADLCGACHRELVGRSSNQIRTVRVGEHSGGLDCTKCHDPHQPLTAIRGGK
jgi:hypothetical protein